MNYNKGNLDQTLGSIFNNSSVTTMLINGHPMTQSLNLINPLIQYNGTLPVSLRGDLNLQKCRLDNNQGSNPTLSCRK